MDAKRGKFVVAGVDAGTGEAGVNAGTGDELLILM